MWHWQKGNFCSNLGLCSRYADMGGQLTCTRGSIAAATGIYTQLSKSWRFCDFVAIPMGGAFWYCEVQVKFSNKFSEPHFRDEFYIQKLLKLHVLYMWVFPLVWSYSSELRMLMHLCALKWACWVEYRKQLHACPQKLGADVVPCWLLRSFKVWS